MSNKIIWKFLGACVALIVVVVFILNFFVGLKLREYYEQNISDRLLSNAVLIADILQVGSLKLSQDVIQNKTKELSDKLDVRITILDADGEVLSDSESDPALMETHKDRLEVVRAIKEGFGESDRFSDTLGYSMKYVALAIKDNDRLMGIVRVALPLQDVEAQIRVIYRIVTIAGITAIAIVFIIGYFISKSITNPIREMKEIAQNIAKGDFTKRVKAHSNDELGALAKSLNKMADELQSQIDSLKNMDRVRTDFVANVSHELKTPLTSIKGFVETLEDGAIDDKDNAERFLSIIKKYTERLGNIINDLLSLSELELGKDRLIKTRFDLKGVVDEVSLGFGHAIAVKNESVKLELSGSDFYINADKAKIEQVLVNLIDNAVKYNKEGGVVTISLTDSKDSVIIAVKDEGQGIPDKYLSRIFERFYRVDKARSSQLGGTGLGLAIVKHIVLLHGGDVHIESQVDRGTKVTVTLPKV